MGNKREMIELRLFSSNLTIKPKIVVIKQEIFYNLPSKYITHHKKQYKIIGWSGAKNHHDDFIICSQIIAPEIEGFSDVKQTQNSSRTRTKK